MMHTLVGKLQSNCESKNITPHINAINNRKEDGIQYKAQHVLHYTVRKKYKAPLKVLQRFQ